MLTGDKNSNIFTLGLSTLTTVETIKDYDQGNQAAFNAAEGDVIDLSALTNAAFTGGQATATFVRLEQDISGLFSWLEIKTADTGNQWQKVAELDGLNAGSLVTLNLGTSGPNIQQSLAVPGYQSNWSIAPGANIFDESAGTVTFTVTRVDTTSAETIYASTSGTFGAANSGDFNAIVGVPLVFTAGQATQTFTIHINNDAIAESYETFGIFIHSQTTLTATDVIGSTTFTIKDNDVLTNNTFTTGADFTTLNMATGSHSINMLAGTDTAIVDFSATITAIYTGSVTNGVSFADGVHTATLVNVENYVVAGGSNADTIYTGAGNDTLIGGGGADYLNAGTGQDVISGGTGDDTLAATGAGADSFDGGTGIDRLVLDRSDLTSAVVIDGASTHFADGTSIANIELFDVITGSGDDRVALRMINGSQSFDGGAGNDTAIVDFSGVAIAVYTGGLTNGVYFSDGTRTATMYNVENFMITGGSNADTIYTGAGNDTLIGGDGPDYLDAGTGQDHIYGGNGDDTLVATGAGADSFDGGAGIDRLQLNRSDLATNVVIDGALTYFSDGTTIANIELFDVTTGTGDDRVAMHMAYGSQTFDGGAGNDTAIVDFSSSTASVYTGGLTNGIFFSDNTSIATMYFVENYNVTGGSGADTIYTGAGNDTLDGGGGADHLGAGAGQDSITGGAGNDWIDGGAGFDTAVYSVAMSAATITHNLDGSWTVTDALDNTDTLTNIEALQFTDRKVYLQNHHSDFNSDGTADLLWFQGSSGTPVISDLTNNVVNGGGHNFGAVGPQWTLETTGDFNGDGSSDFMWKNTTTGNFYVWNVWNNTQSGGASLGNIGTNWDVVGSGDFNNDGTGDILWRNSTNGQLYIYNMHNDAVSSTSSLGVLGTDWKAVAVGDFNGDGTADVMLQRQSDGLVYAWDMTNSAVSNGFNFGAIGANWNVMGAGDFNNDGISDLVLRDSNTGQLYLWMLDQQSHLASGSNLGVIGTDWTVAHVGDANGDGTADLFLKNTTTGLFYIWDIVNGHHQGDASLGTVGTDWNLV